MVDINIQSQDVRTAIKSVPLERLAPEASVSFETQSAESLGKESLGKESLGKETLGKESLGKESLGKESLGKSAVVREEFSSPRSVSSLSNESNIVTFRDSETGKLVIKLVGRQNNEVLAEFPSPNQLSLYPAVGETTGGSGGIDQSV